MFGKLVKHEFRATARIIPFVFLVTVFLALVHMLTVRLNLGILANLSFVLVFIMCFAQVAVTIILIVWRYYKSLYSNEGYLTHTLPVAPSKHLWSKLLVGGVWYLAAILLAFGTIATVISTDIQMKDIVTYDKLVQVMGIQNNQAIFWGIVAAMLLIGVVQTLAEAYFAITVGSVSKLHKLGIGGPVLIFFAEYIGLQIINTAGMFLIPLGLEMGGAQNEMTFRIVNRNMLSVFLDAIKTNAPSNSGIVGIGTFIMLPIVITALLIITSRVLNRNTSIR
jgi:hypothetical protein